MKKKITLKRIKLSNWKSLNLDITLNEMKNTIKGENGIGKSSLQYAWNWLWTGYCNSYTPKNFELYDNTKEITHETPIASVKVWINIDGIEYTIEKTAQAKFTRKRGTNEYVKDSSDTYKIFIDEIEISATDFNSWIDNNICDCDMLLYCLDGSSFTTLCIDDKRKGRKVLETIVGEIKEDDFSGDYSCLKDDFSKGYTIEQIDEKTKSLIKPLRERASNIPAIIDVKEKSYSEFMSINYDNIQKEIDARKNDINQIDNIMLGRNEAIQPILGKRDAIFDLINSKTLKLNEQKNVHLNAYNAIRNEIKSKIANIKSSNLIAQSHNDTVKLGFDTHCKDLELAKKELLTLTSYIETLRQRKDEIKSRVFAEDNCPYCKQELPIDMLDSAKEKFNKNKQEDLDFVVAQGKQTKEKIVDCEKRIKELQAIVDRGFELMEYKSTEKLEQELKAHDASYQPFEDTEEFKMLVKEIDELKSSLPEIPQEDNDALINMKRALLEEIGNYQKTMAKKEIADDLKREIEELRKEYREIGNEIARLEGVLMKCKEYIEERADIISLRVNDKLTHSKIVMYTRQKNGENTPDCIITSDEGVKYQTLNNAMRILTNIEIQELFCNHYGIELVTFVDEASIFSDKNLPKLQKQCVYLHASNDKKLCFS